MFDFKKEFKSEYQPKTTPAIIEIPPMQVLAADGEGDPNTSESYREAVEALYALAYAIKMGNKATLEYVVPPLEGFWKTKEEFRGGGAPITDKSKFIWTMFIRQPDFVNEEIFEAAKATVAKKKPHLALDRVRLESIKEGLCVQVLHLGSYDDEPATIVALDQFAVDEGYVPDMADGRRHHEIYLSDPRKVAAEKLKTVIRHPIK